MGTLVRSGICWSREALRDALSQKTCEAHDLRILMSYAILCNISNATCAKPGNLCKNHALSNRIQKRTSASSRWSHLPNLQNKPKIHRRRHLTLVRFKLCRDEGLTEPVVMADLLVKPIETQIIRKVLPMWLLCGLYPIFPYFSYLYQKRRFRRHFIPFSSNKVTNKLLCLVISVANFGHVTYPLSLLHQHLLRRA